MASVNKVILLGNLGRDPEIRYTPSGTAVANVSIATTRSWKNRESGDRQEETEWHRVVFYDRLAEIVGEYVKKGHPLYVEGRLKTRKWEKDGVDHYATEIIAESMQLLASRDSGGESGGQRGGEQRQQRGEGQQQRPAQRQQRPQGNQQSRPATGFDDMADDIPF